jgi:hypothetical protein
MISSRNFVVSRVHKTTSQVQLPVAMQSRHWHAPRFDVRKLTQPEGSMAEPHLNDFKFEMGAMWDGVTTGVSCRSFSVPTGTGTSEFSSTIISSGSSTTMTFLVSECGNAGLQVALSTYRKHIAHHMTHVRHLLLVTDFLVDISKSKSMTIYATRVPCCPCLNVAVAGPYICHVPVTRTPSRRRSAQTLRVTTAVKTLHDAGFV